MPHPAALPTLAVLQARLALGETTCETIVAQALEHAAEADAAHVFIRLHAASALAAARAADRSRRQGVAALPALAGMPVTVKDLFDIEGEVTLAGSPGRADLAPAQADALSVARLRAQGAAILGRTTMTELAFSGVGLNPHTGTPRNPADRAVARIPGGSSAGAAVSVALGLAVAGLGSDTGGSIRIPAALCGLVGFKNTQSRTPRAGAVELSRSLDTVCALARCVADVLTMDAAIAGAPLLVRPRPLHGMRLAVPGTLLLDDLEPPVAQAFDAALARLSAAGAQIVSLPLALLARISELNAPAGLASIEAFAAHGHRLGAGAAVPIEPRVARRIEAGRGVSAAQYLGIQDQRRAWAAELTTALHGFDALLCPTVPIVAPAMASLVHDDDAFFHTNGLLLRNTFAVNFWDGCAFSLPCQRAGDLRVGLMLAAPGGHDAALAEVALAVEAALAAPP